MSIQTQLSELSIQIGEFSAAISNKLGTKADMGHPHAIAEVAGLQVALDQKETPTGAQSKADLAQANAIADADTKLALKANLNEVLTPAEVDARIQAVIDMAPTTLDTLAELAAALGNDPNFATTMTTELAKKLDSASLPGLLTPFETIANVDAKDASTLVAANTYSDSQLESAIGSMAGYIQNATMVINS